MKVQGKNYRSIWQDYNDKHIIKIIDQRKLPHQFVIENIHTSDQMAVAIKDMWVRGAGLIGAAAAYGIYLACLEAKEQAQSWAYILNSADKLTKTRPTAVNLQWAVKRMLNYISGNQDIEQLIVKAEHEAQAIANEDANSCRMIGQNGLKLIEDLRRKKNGKTLNILTHCNAGWLAFVDYGSALAPIYAAYKQGIDIHIWVDETRPRNQGAKLTAWELKQYGIPHSIIADNTGGHLMQHGLVDMVIIGADRCSRKGDIANKIGSYLKALAAKDNDIPFYVAFPSSTIDWNISDGIQEIPIEQRNAREVKYMEGLNHQGQIEEILICPQDSPAVNYGFDVTPARLITAFITEKGVCPAEEKALIDLLSKRKR